MGAKLTLPEAKDSGNLGEVGYRCNWHVKCAEAV